MSTAKPTCHASSTLPGKIARRWDLLAALLLLLATSPWWIALSCPFIELDDGVYIANNPQVMAGLSPHGIAWAFSNTETGFWIPFTWLSLMLDATLFGARPWGFHLTNVILHLANAWLVFALLRRMTAAPWRSLLVALFFAVHPLRVESVAWATERKDVLALFFGLLTLAAYLSYVRQNNPWRYALTLTLYAGSLLVKPMLVTLPLILLLLDFWPLGRISRAFRVQPSGCLSNRQVSLKRSILEKLPFALAAGPISVVAWIIQAATSHGAYEPLKPLPERLVNALVSCALYLRDTFYFNRLALLYPWRPPTPAIQWVPSLLLLLAVTIFVAMLAARKTSGRPLLVGWLWFLIALLPVIGLVQSGDQSRADRFTYFPSIGLFIALVWAWTAAWTRTRRQRITTTALAIAAVIALVVCMTTQLLLWRNPLQLYLKTVDRTRDNWFIMSFVAQEYQRQGKTDLAIGCCREIVRLAPFMSEPEYNLGAMLAKKGHLDEALVHLRRAHEISPQNPVYQRNFDGLRKHLESRGPAATTQPQ